MRIGIHHSKFSFSDRWIAYCESKSISFRLVDCFKADIMQQLSDCDALMWHFSQNNTKAILFAKQLIYSVEASGRKAFPNFNTIWHFDDKVGQKYLLEAVGAPLARTWIFYDEAEAIDWVRQAEFPLVFKLRGGAGSQNVLLAHSSEDAIKLIRRAFGSGFSSYDAMGSLKERFRRYRLGNTNFKDLIEGVVRFAIPPPYSKIRGREKGYIYFQEYIPGNSFDIRVIVIGDKAFAIKRLVRKHDFRASGSGMIVYEKESFNVDTIRLAFQMAGRIKSQCAAFDFVYSGDNIYVLEVSYGFIKEVYDPCVGFWDSDLNWHEGKFNPYGWIVEDLLNDINRNQ